MRVSGKATERFDAVVRAADALLAVQRDADESASPEGKSFVRVG
jgi:hypothetical protein